MTKRASLETAALDGRLRETVAGYRRSQVIYAAVKLGIPDALSADPLTSEVLARACGADPEVLPRFLSVLTAEDLLAEEAGRYRLTPLGARLCSNSSGGLSDWVITSCEEQFQAWGHVLHTLRTGTPAFDAAFGMSFWDYLGKHREAAEAYQAGMAGSIRDACELALETCDFTGVRHLVDVGAGRGVLSRAVLTAIDGLRVTLADLPEVVAHAGELLRQAGFGDRVTLAPGSFLADVPAGGDLYVLCRVLADWGEDDARRILENCRRAMEPGSRLLIVEGLTPMEGGSGARGLLDLHLLLLIGGRERTEAELRDMLTDSGFHRIRVAHAAHGRLSAVEAEAAR
ncbi:methyltransferase [Streptomyces sp. NPDC006355]|uniref:methyltransferase n=1 Tax=Streptomyces sp. NPDC006355 TaxID=3156758 RepID=UPI0033BE11AB